MWNANDHDEALDNLTDEKLLEIVKKNLDKSGIVYKNEPGGFGGFLPLDAPSVENIQPPSA